MWCRRTIKGAFQFFFFLGVRLPLLTHKSSTQCTCARDHWGDIQCPVAMWSVLFIFQSRPLFLCFFLLKDATKFHFQFEESSRPCWNMAWDYVMQLRQKRLELTDFHLYRVKIMGRHRIGPSGFHKKITFKSTPRILCSELQFSICTHTHDRKIPPLNPSHCKLQ